MGSFFDALSIYRGGPHNDIKLNRRSHNEDEFSNRNELFQKRGSCWQLADQSEMPDKHEVTDFKLGRLGELVSCETETDQTGWVIVKTRGNINVGDEIPLL